MNKKEQIFVVKEKSIDHFVKNYTLDGCFSAKGWGEKNVTPPDEFLLMNCTDIESGMIISFEFKDRLEKLGTPIKSVASYRVVEYDSISLLAIKNK